MGQQELGDKVRFSLKFYYHLSLIILLTFITLVAFNIMELKLHTSHLTYHLHAWLLIMDSTELLHFCLSTANVLASFQFFQTLCVLSFSTVRLQVVFGLPLFLFPSGAQVNTMSSAKSKSSRFHVFMLFPPDSIHTIANSFSHHSVQCNQKQEARHVASLFHTCFDVKPFLSIIIYCTLKSVIKQSDEVN